MRSMRQFILASGSIRRKDLLEFLGVPFEIRVSHFPEEDVQFTDLMDPQDYVLARASGKGLLLAQEYPDAIILSADTDVFLHGQVFGKPKDLDDARRILKALRGQKHQVFTGFFLIDTLTGERYAEAVESRVEFFPFSDEELERYIATSESIGKAGAYAVQLGAKRFVKEVQGSLSNVVGLPLLQVATALEQLGIPIDVDVREIEERFFTHES